MRTSAGLPYSEPTTSRAAAESITPQAPRLRELVYATIAAAGSEGRTTDELEGSLGLSHQTCSPRVTELARQGRIQARGTRKTRSGRAATVWVIATTEERSNAA